MSSYDGEYEHRYVQEPISSNHNYSDSEKVTNTSKREKLRKFWAIWRKIRVGAALALTIAALVLTLIILVAGRHGNGSSDLSLLTVSASGGDTSGV